MSQQCKMNDKWKVSEQFNSWNSLQLFMQLKKCNNLCIPLPSSAHTAASSSSSLKFMILSILICNSFFLSTKETDLHYVMHYFNIQIYQKQQVGLCPKLHRTFFSNNTFQELETSLVKVWALQPIGKVLLTFDLQLSIAVEPKSSSL